MSEQSQTLPRKFQRRRRPFSLAGIIIGLILGISGGLIFTWVLSPLQEVDTEPWQLNAEHKTQYVAAITLNYAQTGDLGAAVNRLVALRLPGDPIQAVADMACELATTGYTNNTSGMNAVRSMMRFYQLQGRGGCADQIIPAESSQGSLMTIEVPTATVTLTPPPSKTPTPAATFSTPTPVVVVVPTRAPQSDFDLISVNTACDTGIIRVFVYESNGSTGIPGMEIRARWDGGESRFFTGLKPERGAGYADFAMDTDRDYLLDMPERSDPVSQTLSPVPCTTTTGERGRTSYTVIFRSTS